jgi:hypothetical protein
LGKLAPSILQGHSDKVCPQVFGKWLLMGALFLPLYFTLLGLNTSLRLLDDGITWEYLIEDDLVKVAIGVEVISEVKLK